MPRYGAALPFASRTLNHAAGGLPLAAGDLFPGRESLYRAYRATNSQVTSTRLRDICHSNATQSKEVLGSTFEKRSQPGAPLRNRTVDLLLTMYRSAVPQPQAGRLTSANTSTHWHSQAPDKPTRAPFATQSDTHFDLAEEPPYEVVDIKFDDRAVCVHGLSPRLTSANRFTVVYRSRTRCRRS